MMKRTSFGELDLIRWIQKRCHGSATVNKGIGDDTAVLSLNTTEDLLFTTDMSVEGTHFAKRTPPELIGRKALARNLSDIAAMGGMPTFAVVSLGCSKSRARDIKKIYFGINRLAKQFGVGIVGGDTVKSDQLVINIALLGTVAKGKAVLRSGAKVGDRIYVTGRLGGSFESKRHLTFTPRIKEAQIIMKHHPTSMIDISDGLAGDLGHILEESGVGAIIEEKRIPLHRGADLKAGLYDGEDFELLFTLCPKLNGVCPYLSIGEVTNDKNRLFMRDRKGKLKKIIAKGFTHF